MRLRDMLIALVALASLALVAVMADEAGVQENCPAHGVSVKDTVLAKEDITVTVYIDGKPITPLSKLKETNAETPPFLGFGAVGAVIDFRVEALDFDTNTCKPSSGDGELVPNNIKLVTPTVTVQWGSHSTSLNMALQTPTKLPENEAEGVRAPVWTNSWRVAESALGTHIKFSFGGIIEDVLCTFHTSSKDEPVDLSDYQARAICLLLDLDIDSLHSGDFNGPQHSEEEEAIEGIYPLEGENAAHKYIPVNDFHAVGGYVPGYANFEGLAETLPKELRFTPITLTLLPEGIPQAHLNKMSVSMYYNASPPAGVSSNQTEKGWQWVSAPGNLRIWRKDIDVARDKSPVFVSSNSVIGDYIPSQTSLPLSLLGLTNTTSVTWYVEGIRPTQELGYEAIRAWLEGIPPTAHTEDTIHCTPARVGVNVDTFNNSGYEKAVHGKDAKNSSVDVTEDHYEDYIDGTNHVGRILVVADGDADCDGITDFADGYALETRAESKEDKEARFVPIVFELPSPIDVDRAYVRLTYPASDPLAVTNHLAAGGYKLPQHGSLRIWSKDGNVKRNGKPISQGGSFVAEGEYKATDFGFATTNRTLVYYMEAVRPSKVAGDIRVLFEVKPDERAGVGFLLADAVRITAVRMALVPDYDRNGKIDDQDAYQASTNRVFRWWRNDDDDNGTDISTGENDIPGQGYGFSTTSNDVQLPDSFRVDGRCDLLDFFPLCADLSNLLTVLPALENMELRLSHPLKAVQIVYTKLSPEKAGSFLIEPLAECGPELTENSYKATTIAVPKKGLAFPQLFVDHIATNQLCGIMMVEGYNLTANKQQAFSIDFVLNDKPVGSHHLHLSISSVEDMYRMHNLRFKRSWVSRVLNPRLEERLGNPSNLPDAELKDMDVFLAHGYLVGENESRAWGSEFFKRLWQSGSNARFHSVTWTGDGSPPYSAVPSTAYEYNVNNAFITAGQYAARVNAIKSANKAPVIAMAHSLGCMLTSAAISDHKMEADKFIALNGAVASEAFYGGMADLRASEENSLLHPAWREYESRTWSANFHQLFPANAGVRDDHPSKLTWRNRFDLTAPILYNFWSSGDEVLEISPRSDITIGSGIEFDWKWSVLPVSMNTRRYVWQKQALFKGRSLLYGTTWAGWEFHYFTSPEDDYPKRFSPEEANQFSDADLRERPIFCRSPKMLFRGRIKRDNQNKLLAWGIPELSYPIGYIGVEKKHSASNIDMHVDLRRTDEVWPQRSFDFNTPNNTRTNRWLHTDLQNVAYYYTYKLFNQIADIGEMK